MVRKARQSRLKYSLYDAFESRKSANSSAKDLRSQGDKVTVRKISPQAGGRLKYGVFRSEGRYKFK